MKHGGTDRSCGSLPSNLSNNSHKKQKPERDKSINKKGKCSKTKKSMLFHCREYLNKPKYAKQHESLTSFLKPFALPQKLFFINTFMVTYSEEKEDP